jgi:symplekin
MLAARDHPPPPHDIAARLHHLRDLRRVPLPNRIADFHTDEASPVRKLVAE